MALERVNLKRKFIITTPNNLETRTIETVKLPPFMFGI